MCYNVMIIVSLSVLALDTSKISEFPTNYLKPENLFVHVFAAKPVYYGK